MDSLAIGGLCDPYIQFISYPKSLLYNTKKKTWPSTKVIKRTLNPVWEEVVHVSLDQGPCNNSNTAMEHNLAGSMLYLTVMDDDYSLDNEVVGTVALNLSDLCSNLHTPGPFAVQRTEIKRPILRNGKEFGTLECTISSAYCSAKEDKAFVNSAERAKSRGMNPLLQAIRRVYSFD
jgi:Ca2+-dependent lipid-binding protein